MGGVFKCFNWLHRAAFEGAEPAAEDVRNDNSRARPSCSPIMAPASQDSQPPPKVLYVCLQNEGDHDLLKVSGRYQLHEEHTHANGMPVWKKSDEGVRHERWLFSCTGQKWCIHGNSAKKACFQMNDPSLNWLWLDLPHSGRMPHELPSSWKQWGPHEAMDADIVVKVPFSP